VADPIQPKQQINDPTQTGSKYFDLDPSQQLLNLVKPTKKNSTQKRRILYIFMEFNFHISVSQNLFVVHLLYPSQSMWGGSSEILYRDGDWCDVTCPYVTSFSSHTSEARGLKIGMHIIVTWMAQKLQSRFLILCLKAEIFKLKVLYLRL